MRRTLRLVPVLLVGFGRPLAALQNKLIPWDRRAMARLRAWRG